ncbi:MAG: NAD-dependent epimerase/dehydratase family protein [Candidatus Omnitrophica bacterium]|nr:NAD-dependent epimerase/dehydratase family protein [Candidatus Omnitrophota bacterium]
MSKQAIVTGGAGFIGSHLADALLADGWTVVVIDNLSTGNVENIPDRADLLQIDISQDDFLNYMPTGKFDAIFHLAGQSSGEISFADPQYDAKANILGTVLLLEWCRRTGTDRMIYAGTMGVYGNVTSPVSEDAPLAPLSFYGTGRLANENYLRIYRDLGVQSTVLRLFNVFGPRQNMANLRQGMVSIFMSYVAAGEPILVKGSKERYRDIVYVDDVVRAFILSESDDKAVNETFNVGTGRKTHVYELLDCLIEVFGYKPGEFPVEYVGNTPGDQFGIFADVSKIKRILNWIPEVDLKDGLTRMREWLLETNRVG